MRADDIDAVFLTILGCFLIKSDGFIPYGLIVNNHIFNLKIGNQSKKAADVVAVAMGYENIFDGIGAVIFKAVKGKNTIVGFGARVHKGIFVAARNERAGSLPHIDKIDCGHCIVPFVAKAEHLRKSEKQTAAV